MSNPNFTQVQGLVIPITEQGWFKRPAGREGYEVVVLEKVATGNRYYCTLRPGETLRFGEVVLGKFLVYAVDMRYGKAFPVEGEFATQERNRKVTLKANVRYRVTDSRQVAVGADDPLAEVRSKVVAALNRELARYPHDSVNEALCEGIIRKVGYFPNLGLSVEGAEITQFRPESRVLGYRTEEEEQEHKLRLQARAAEAEMQEVSRRERARMDLDEERIRRFDLRDPNIFMHIRQDLVPRLLDMMDRRQEMELLAQGRGIDIMDRAIRAYLDQQIDAGKDYVNLDEVANAVRTYLLPGGQESPAGARIDFGPITPPLPSEETHPPEKLIEFGEEEEEGKQKDEGKRIEFGE